MNHNSKACSAHVTLKRGRVKEYGSDRSVHLKDGQEFEIELFNPHPKSVLAKIFINGSPIGGGGIVLRPGQRIFLERYLDDDRKFKFTTYEVENSREAVEAIAKNGNVEVQFFYEAAPHHGTITISPNSTTNFWQWGHSTGGYVPRDWTYNTCNTTTNPNNSNSLTTFNLNSSSDFTTKSFYCNTNSFQNAAADFYKSMSQDSIGGSLASSSLETGRVEHGSRSKQEFTSVNETFNAWYSEVTYLKILPFSQKPVEASEIRNYCPHCVPGFAKLPGNIALSAAIN